MTDNCKPKEGSQSPWGTIDGVTDILPGMWFVSTPSHGGIKLSPERQKQIPESLRLGKRAVPYVPDTGKSWYEEDCEWAIPYCVFEKELKEQGRGIAGKLWSNERHKETLRTWYPDQYEKFYGVTLKPGESGLRDEKVFYAKHFESWLGICARGSWAEGVPKGFVEVIARQGGRERKDTKDERVFLVREERYKTGGGPGVFTSYVIDFEQDEELFKGITPTLTKGVGLGSQN